MDLKRTNPVSFRSKNILGVRQIIFSSISFFFLKFLKFLQFRVTKYNFSEQKLTGIERFRNSSNDPEDLSKKYSV